MDENRRVFVEDIIEHGSGDPVANHLRAMEKVPPPPLEFASDLDTIEKARTWLLHPSNWRDSTLFILKWDGLIPTYIARHQAERLIREPWDTGMYEVVVRHQRNLRMRKRQGESIDESEPLGE